MTTQPNRPADDISSAPESGTVRGPTGGNKPSKKQDARRDPEAGKKGPEDEARNPGEPSDDVSSAPESGTVREGGPARVVSPFWTCA